MTITLGFDIYGTLIDPHGVTVKLGELIGDQAPAFSRLWAGKTTGIYLPSWPHAQLPELSGVHAQCTRLCRCDF